MKRAAFHLLLSVTLTGCTGLPQGKVAPRMAFPESEYVVLAKTGIATVKGQAFLKTRAGDVKTAAGNEVFLNPVTSYSLEWYEAYRSNRRIEERDPRLDEYVRSQLADGNGRFSFKNVPAGEYFLTTNVTWEAPTGFQGALQRQGGIISTRIKVNEGDEIEVIVTR